MYSINGSVQPNLRYTNVLCPPLLDNYHPPGGRIILCQQVIEVQTACHPLTDFVSPIPIGRFRPILVDRRNPMPNVERTDDPTATVIDGQRHKSILRQPIRYPCLWVERIWIVCATVLSPRVSRRQPTSGSSTRLRFTSSAVTVYRNGSTLINGEGDLDRDFNAIPNHSRPPRLHVNHGESIANSFSLRSVPFRESQIYRSDSNQPADWRGILISYDAWRLTLPVERFFTMTRKSALPHARHLRGQRLTLSPPKWEWYPPPQYPSLPPVMRQPSRRYYTTHYRR